MLGGCLPARFLDRRRTSSLCSGKIDALLSEGSLKLLGQVGATTGVKAQNEGSFEQNSRFLLHLVI